MFIGMFAAELLVKNAVKPLSFKHFKISGYGFLRSILNTMIGFVTNTVNNIHPTNKANNLP